MSTRLEQIHDLLFNNTERLITEPVMRQCFSLIQDELIERDAKVVADILDNVDPDTDTLKEVRTKLLELAAQDGNLMPLSTWNNFINNVLPTYARKFPINFTQQEKDAWMAFFNQSTTASIPILENTISGFFLATELQTYNFVIKGLNLSNLLLGTGLTEWKLYYPNGSAVPLSNYSINTFQVNGNESVTISIQINTVLQTAGDYILKLYRDMQYLGQTKLKCWNGFTEDLIPLYQLDSVYYQDPTQQNSATSVQNGTININGLESGGTSLNYQKAVVQNVNLPEYFELSFFINSTNVYPYQTYNNFVAGVELAGLVDFLPTKIIIGVIRKAMRYVYGISETKELAYNNGSLGDLIFSESANAPNLPNVPATKVIIKRDGVNLEAIYYDKNNNIVGTQSNVLNQNTNIRFACYFAPNTNYNDEANITLLTLKTFN